MKILQKMENSDVLYAQIHKSTLGLEAQIRAALAEPAKRVSPAQFKKRMKAIGNGR